MYELWKHEGDNQIFIMSAPIKVITKWCNKYPFTKVSIQKIAWL